MSEHLDAQALEADTTALLTAALHDDREAGELVLAGCDLYPLAWSLAFACIGALEHAHLEHGCLPPAELLERMGASRAAGEPT